CYHCGEVGHIARNCQAAFPTSNDVSQAQHINWIDMSTLNKDDDVLTVMHSDARNLGPKDSHPYQAPKAVKVEKSNLSGPPAAKGNKSVSFKLKASTEMNPVPTQESMPFPYPANAVTLLIPVCQAVNAML
ncbi:hypothetical protein BG006_004277, partial [Podila minutissima]